MADGLWEGLVDFSFQKRICAPLVKVVYIIAVLAGGITVIVFVVAGMQQSAAQGLLVLLGGVVIMVCLGALRAHGARGGSGDPPHR